MNHKRNGTQQQAPAQTATHSEAPASATARMVSPGGIEWFLTIRSDSVNDMMKKIFLLEAHLLSDGWKASGRGQGGDEQAASDTPLCPYHGPMKRSTKFNGWYCPKKLHTGEYCSEQVKE